MLLELWGGFSFTLLLGLSFLYWFALKNWSFYLKAYKDCAVLLKDKIRQLEKAEESEIYWQQKYIQEKKSHADLLKKIEDKIYELRKSDKARKGTKKTLSRRKSSKQ